jgi:hypothetical protein
MVLPFFRRYSHALRSRWRLWPWRYSDWLRISSWTEIWPGVFSSGASYNGKPQSHPSCWLSMEINNGLGYLYFRNPSYGRSTFYGSVWKYSNGKVNWDKCWWTMKVWGALVSIRETSCANWFVARFNDSSPSCLWRFQFTVFLCFVLNGLVSN